MRERGCLVWVVTVSRAVGGPSHLGFGGISPEEGLAGLAGDGVEVVAQGLVAAHPAEQLGAVTWLGAPLLFLLDLRIARIIRIELLQTTTTSKAYNNQSRFGLSLSHQYCCRPLFIYFLNRESV